MVSLWGSKKDSDEDGVGRNGSGGEDRPRSSQSTSQNHPRDASERDPLLGTPRRHPHADGYLDPDDPAVSPYNLWTVRLLRYVTILFLAISFLWWVLLLVSIFVSPPGLHTRGSGFFDFAYTCLTIGLLLCQLLFFAAPSRAMRICQGLVGVFLLVDLIIIVSVERLRFEEGPPGIASVVWATLMAIWSVLVDRAVAWGKREEEERLTGRPETRRTLREWLAVLVATIILVVFIIITILMTATLILRSRDASLRFDGERVYVDSGKYQVHLACLGNVTYDANGRKNPTVLLEAGEDPLEYDFEHWAYSAWKNGTIDRYCYWDRPGYAWSDNAPSPHSAGMSVDNLGEALAVTGEEGPWVLVSAGYGSILSRIFLSRHFKEIAGVMMIDPLHEDLLHRLANPGRGFILWAWGIISPLGIQRLAGAVFKGRTREDRVYGREAYQGGKFIKAQLQENLVADSLTKSEVATARQISSGSKIPLVIVSSGISVRKDDEWNRKQQDLTTITDNLLGWDIVNKAPHLVWRTLDGRNVMEKRLADIFKANEKKEKKKKPSKHINI
ncbi:integral membrane protein [Polychaeton citri CBS 116435]|uniref:Integral membrane protein n=1 Tax=Polychaeton citri CBS 116435 TaxID=1314669 RepID=A0A9P4PYD9_9PEZI|nr:integral membrane protein [Polychaeton citri CBS 116435]